MRSFLILSASFLLACGKPKPAPDEDPAPARAQAAAKAREIFSTRCTPCHGATGAGDGPASASLQPRPRNFHDADWQKQWDRISKGA